MGVSRNQYTPEIFLVRVKCTGRVDTADIMQALRDGADGVAIFGCHKGECDFGTGNYAAERHVNAAKFMLEEAGIEPERVGIYFMSAAEIERFLRSVNDFTSKINRLPFNPLKRDRSRGLTVDIGQ